MKKIINYVKSKLLNDITIEELKKIKMDKIQKRRLEYQRNLESFEFLLQDILNVLQELEIEYLNYLGITNSFSVYYRDGILTLIVFNNSNYMDNIKVSIDKDNKTIIETVAIRRYTNEKKELDSNFRKYLFHSFKQKLKNYLDTSIDNLKDV